jgi:hypothetical protein
LDFQNHWLSTSTAFAALGSLIVSLRFPSR